MPYHKGKPLLLSPKETREAIVRRNEKREERKSLMSLGYTIQEACMMVRRRVPD